MAWLQKRGGVWWIGWRHGGKQFRKSTGETEEAKAQAQLNKLNTLEAARKANAITEEFYRAATGRVIEKTTVSKFLKDWLIESEAYVSKSTLLKYRQVVREFIEHTEADANGLLLEDVTVDHVKGFLVEKRKSLSPGTVNGYKRILSSVFLLAQNQGKMKGNPVALAKSRGKPIEGATIKKRPFTLTELETLYSKASPFWQYMIMGGYFTGQSLGDLVTMRAENVDLATNQIAMRRRKTGKQVIIPIGPKMQALLKSIWPKGGKGYFWPEQAEKYLKVSASPFSQEFYDLMAAAGLVAVREDNKTGTGKGRSAKRETAKLGFHNLRHTFVTHLKIGGAMDSVAKELAGHGSSAMSAIYTHLPPETLAKAVNQLPEFTHD